MVVDGVRSWITRGLFRHLYFGISQLLHLHGTEHPFRPSVGDYTTECQINFVICVIRPVLHGMRGSLLSFLGGSSHPDSVAVSSVAERRYVSTIDRKASEAVWATGCSSWFIDEKTGRNTIMYPDFQFKFWLRSIFIPWKDFVYIKAAKAGVIQCVNPHARGSTVAVALVVLASVMGSLYGGESELRSRVFGSLWSNSKVLSR